MTAGDVPQILNGGVVDARMVADLARRVGQLEAMRVAPPLSLQTTPAGAVISLIETTANDSLDRTTAIPQGALAYAAGAGETAVTLGSSAIVNFAGRYLIAGAMAAQSFFGGSGTILCRWKDLSTGGGVSGWSGVYVPAGIGSPASQRFAIVFATIAAVNTVPFSFGMTIDTTFFTGGSVSFDPTYSLVDIQQLRD